jgi:hypothetical protein
MVFVVVGEISIGLKWRCSFHAVVFSVYLFLMAVKGLETFKQLWKTVFW